MKRRALLKHLRKHGAVLVREGGEHSIFRSTSGAQTSVPRHSEILEGTVNAICKQLGIPKP